MRSTFLGLLCISESSPVPGPIRWPAAASMAYQLVSQLLCNVRAWAAFKLPHLDTAKTPLAVSLIFDPTTGDSAEDR
jgi:hypothetical protein